MRVSDCTTLFFVLQVVFAYLSWVTVTEPACIVVWFIVGLVACTPVNKLVALGCKHTYIYKQ